MLTASTVRIVRAFLAIGQTELTKRMNVSSSLVAAVETGAKRITPEFTKRFKRATGITDGLLIDIEYLRGKLAE
ncbi:XRE family transcriptional regulator [Ectobacillus funiculus]|uniref:XRE family transcriptional regulator n=1 Tax=Ectobacillus funiculus TaxID=137993 RepID=A0ABV5WPF4_9BACI